MSVSCHYGCFLQIKDVGRRHGKRRRKENDEEKKLTQVYQTGVRFYGHHFFPEKMALLQ